MNLRGISSMAMRQILADVSDAWKRESRNEVLFESVGGVDAAQRVLGGEPFDVVVLAADAIERLVGAGRVVAGSKTDLAHSSVAVAVRSGAARPVIDGEASLRKAVLSARTIGHSTGPSGAALLDLFARWQVSDTLRGRLVQAPPGVSVGALVARGDVELGFQQLSELMHVEGIDVLGPLPPGADIVSTFSGGICAACVQPQAARGLLDFIHSPAADEAKRRHGMRPA